MVEYGHGVGQSSGGGGGGSDSGTAIDAGAAIGQMVTDAVDTVVALPPTTLFLAFVVVIVGLMILRRAL